MHERFHHCEIMSTVACCSLPVPCVEVLPRSTHQDCVLVRMQRPNNTEDSASQWELSLCKRSCWDHTDCSYDTSNSECSMIVCHYPPATSAKYGQVADQGSLGCTRGVCSSAANDLCLRAEVSLDSMVSEQDALACDELLLSDLQRTHENVNLGKQSIPLSIFSSTPALTETFEVGEIIRNELRREADTSPCSNYLQRHTAGCEAGITPDMRAVAVSWMVEVVTEYELQQETLFLAVTYLDRFLSTSQAVPRGFLQLVAVACLSLASKQEEVNQRTATEWADIADNCFKREDLLRMEWLIIDALGWRGRTPTAYSFLHLFCHGLATCSSSTICVAAYIVELSLLDYSLLSYSYSTVAAAALMLAHAITNSSFSLSSFLALAPMDASTVMACCQKLGELHQTSILAESYEGCQTILPIREKYSRPEWLNAAGLPATHHLPDLLY